MHVISSGFFLDHAKVLRIFVLRHEKKFSNALVLVLLENDLENLSLMHVVRKL